TSTLLHPSALNLRTDLSPVFKCFLSRVVTCAGKNRRLKQAKEEAQAEIEQYRLQREKEFKTKEAAALGSHGNSAVEVDRDTAEKMNRIQASYRSNREAVLTELLRCICDIQPEFHANYRVAG
uniref:V-type proton ATPase subunit G n=1 Tax=Oreochromis aureus TaxID=47969 RepID=A0A668VE13_OREAU